MFKIHGYNPRPFSIFYVKGGGEKVFLQPSPPFTTKLNHQPLKIEIMQTEKRKTFALISALSAFDFSNEVY